MEDRDRVLDALSRIRCEAVCSEMELHEQARQALLDAGLEAEHEVRLAARCRIDFMSGSIGIEIKKSRPNPSALRAQLARYAACEPVSELIVVAPRGVNLPRMIGGKRITFVALERLWGISLP